MYDLPVGTSTERQADLVQPLTWAGQLDIIQPSGDIRDD